MPDIFDTVGIPQPHGDIFDRVAQGLNTDTLPEVVATPSPERGLGDLVRMKAGLPPEEPFPTSPVQRGLAKTVEGIVPHSLEDIVAMTTLPRPSEFETKDLPESEELGKAWRGEYGPEAQAQAISGTLLQGLPLLHLPFAETPFRATPKDVAFAEQIKAQREAAAQPPPIPPEYAERRFTMQPTPPEAPPELAPAPPIEETLARAAPPIISPETGFGHYPEEVPTTEPRPLRTEFGRLPGGADLQLSPQPGTDLKPVALRGPNGQTPALDLVRSMPQEAPQTAVIPPEHVKYAGGEQQPSGAGPVGISQARTEAELGPGSVEPGIGAEMGSGLEHGRNYINKGGDPRLPIRRANTSGMVGAKDVGIVHAELERLRTQRSAAAAALEANPADPVLQQNFSVADDAQRAWRKELQPVLTKASDSLREAHAMSMPDADVSTYQGLSDLMDEHFNGQREVTPEMRTAMAKAAKGVRDTRDIANGEMKNIEGELTRKIGGKRVMTPAELDADLRKELEGQFSDCFLGK